MPKFKFKKWIRFENHYNEKYISYFRNKIPELNFAKFQIQEKIDGANFSFLFTPKEPVEFCKRTGKAGNFFGYQRLFLNDIYNRFIVTVQNFVDVEKVNLQFVGELFGVGIQKRINYGKHIYWKWFGIYRDGKLIPLEEEEQIRKILIEAPPFVDIWDLRVPVLQMDASLDDFLAFDVEKTKSLIAEDSIVEGICCRNYGEVLYDGFSDYFALKKKTDKFIENVSERKIPVEKNITPKTQNLIDHIGSYVNENRTASLFSKEGVLKEMKEFGKYMGLYTEDVYTDYNKENDNKLYFIDKKEKKLIHKVISTLIRNELIESLKR